MRCDSASSSRSVALSSAAPLNRVSTVPNGAVGSSICASSWRKYASCSVIGIDSDCATRCRIGSSAGNASGAPWRNASISAIASSSVT
jgi:hypothetical protein